MTDDAGAFKVMTTALLAEQPVKSGTTRRLPALTMGELLSTDYTAAPVVRLLRWIVENLGRLAQGQGRFRGLPCERYLLPGAFMMDDDHVNQAAVHEVCNSCRCVITKPVACSNMQAHTVMSSGPYCHEFRPRLS